MTDFKLQVDPEDIRNAIQQALTTALTPEKCQELVKEAISKLLHGSWQSPSDLQNIFHRACESVARDAAEVEMKKPENQERIRVLVTEAWEKVFLSDRREKLLEKVSNAVATALVGREY